MRPSVARPTGTEIGLPVFGDRQAAAQAVGRAERNRAHDAVAELLLHFERQRVAFHLQRVVHLGHLIAGEFDVHHRADALDNLAVSHVRILV